MVAAATALVALLVATLPPLVKAAATLALGAAALRTLRRDACREGPDAVRCLVVDLAGSVEIEHADGSRNRGKLLNGSFVAPWLVIVRWLPEGGRFSRTVVIAPDSVGADAYRRLRVLLRWR
jgi:toxin CptA